jgi:precorrin-6A/cobalt-precorrin-6A reductase
VQRPMSSDSPILILGGTAEAAALARELTARGYPVVTSLAGRTSDPARLSGETRIGGFGGVDGLAAFLEDHRIVALVDATHPFAAQISANAVTAAKRTGTPRIRLERPAWAPLPDDTWITVGSEQAAADALPAGARVLLALGSQHIAPFAARGDVHFVVRMIDKPEGLSLLRDHELILAKPGNVEAETALLRDRRITHLVCRNSGGDASYAKIAAARALGLTVVMIRRPAEPVPPVAASVEEAIAFIDTVLASR